MRSLTLNQTAENLTFFMADSSDGKTGKTGLSPTVTISKNGGAFAACAGAVTEIANGWYKLAGNATDANTLGPLVLHATGSGADPADKEFQIVAYNPRDAVRQGMTALPNAAAEAAGGLFTRGAGAGQINQAANGQIDAKAVAIANDAVTAAALAADAAAEVAAAVLDLTDGVETGVTVRKALRLLTAALGGKVSGAGTTSITFRSAIDAKNRIVATVDANGNRSAVTLDLT